ncbi:MAG: hypothetical protein ACRDJN_01245, partial [Chloroflexota bacterium]
LATFRGWLRLDLNDPAGSELRFADADLDRAVERAVAEYSAAVPRVRDETLSTTAGSRDVSLAGLSGLWSVEEVEWPLGQYPAALVEWQVSPDTQTLTLLTASAPAGEDVRVRWGSKHMVDAATSTVPEGHGALVTLGAYGFACGAYSTPSADNFRYEDGATTALVDDTAIPVEWRRRAEAALAEFRRQLTGLAKSRTLAGRKRVVWSVRRPGPRYPAAVDGREP